MSAIIKSQTFDEERSLYNLTDSKVEDCVFRGPRDGESVLKESHNVELSNCQLSLRYPLWHATDFKMVSSSMDIDTRAPLWYANRGHIEDCTILSPKCLRECSHVNFFSSSINSAEFGWKCSDLTFSDCKIESEYFLFECENVLINHMQMKGKYSFQYIDNMTINDSNLDTKDAFWHTRGVTVTNSVVKGEYLGWYSEDLTLINCKISGTQPLCYCKNLRLINCTMDNCDLAFEYSDVNAYIQGHITSVKTPKSGIISADSIGEIITEGAVMPTNCTIVQREHNS